MFGRQASHILQL
jgi:hypothetical protein